MKLPRHTAIIAGVIAILIMPLFVTDSYILHLMILSMIFAVAAASWDITIGYCGLFNFAHMTFFGIAAYTSAILSTTYGITPWITMPIGALSAVLASLVVGLPSLRLGGVYVAMFGLAFLQVVGFIYLFDPFNLTHGPNGIQLVPPLSIGPISFGGLNKIPNYYYTLILLAISAMALYKLVKSPVGLALQAIRDNENYAMSRGISPYKFKIIAWVVSAFFSGLAGAFYPHYNGVVSLETLGFSLVALTLSYLVVGGMGTIFGPILGAFFMTFVSEQLRGLAGYRFLVVAVAVILVVALAKGGLADLITRLFKALQPKTTLAKKGIDNGTDT